MADTSLVRGGHELGDVGVEAVQLLYVVRCTFHGPLGDQEGPGEPLSISLAIVLLLSQPFDLLVLRLDDLLKDANPSLDRGGAVLEGLVAEGDDILAMLAAGLFR